MDFTAIIVAFIGSGVMVINSIVTYQLNKAKTHTNDTEKLKRANRLIMKNTLRQLCIKYIDQGWIYEDELEDLMAMHDCYHNDLGGNGFLDTLMKHVNSLRIEKDRG